MLIICSTSGRAESTESAQSFVKICNFKNVDTRDRRNHELSNSHSPCHADRLTPEINEQHLDLATVVGVDCARRVEHRQTMPHCQTGARSHLAFEAGGQ